MFGRRARGAADNFRGVRALIISLPPIVMAGSMFVLFCVVSAVTRRQVIRRFSAEVREELAEQANNLLTGVSATFAFFIGFAISICWGAVTAAQNAVEQQAADVQRMSWEIRDIPDNAVSSALGDKLAVFARAAADEDSRFLASGNTLNLPSAAALDSFEDAVKAYASGPGVGGAGPTLLSAASSLVASSAGVSAVATRAVPRPLVALLFIVAMLVTIILGVTTVTSGRASMIFIYIWCLIPALSLAVVLVLAFPFALRSGMTLAPMRAAAHSVAGHG